MKFFHLKKRSYLLLEILIAMMLVSICIFPFMSMLSHQLYPQLALLERSELERVSECVYADLVKRLYLQQIPLKQLKVTHREIPIEESSFELSIGPSFKHRFQKKVYLWTKEEKTGVNGEIFRLLGVKITFVPRPNRGHHQREIHFMYRLIVSEKQQSVEKKGQV